MISQVSDYLFVQGNDIDDSHPHGDLDRIIINGEVMPLRTGNTDRKDKDGNTIPKQNILRGEDIAFLLEALSERYAATYSLAPFKRETFFRSVNKSNITDIQYGIVSRATDGSYGIPKERGSQVWLKPGYQSLEPVFNCASDDSPYKLYPSYYIGLDDVHPIASSDQLRQLQKKRILDCFEDVAKFSFLTTNVNIDYDETPITESDYVVSGTYKKEKTSWRPSKFCGMYQYIVNLHSEDYKEVIASCSYNVNSSKKLVIRNNSFIYAKSVRLYGLFRLYDSPLGDGTLYYGFVPIATVDDIDVDKISITAGQINSCMLRMLQNAQADKGDEPSIYDWLTWFQMNDPATPKYEDVGGWWMREINLSLNNLFALIELNDRTRLPN